MHPQPWLNHPEGMQPTNHVHMEPANNSRPDICFIPAAHGIFNRAKTGPGLRSRGGLGQGWEPSGPRTKLHWCFNGRRTVSMNIDQRLDCLDCAWMRIWCWANRGGKFGWFRCFFFFLNNSDEKFKFRFLWNFGFLFIFLILSIFFLMIVKFKQFMIQILNIYCSVSTFLKISFFYK